MWKNTQLFSSLIVMYDNLVKMKTSGSKFEIKIFK